MSRKARYESTQSAESKGKKRLGDFARGSAQAPPCTEKNDALQNPADQRAYHQKDNPPQGAHHSHGHRCRMPRLQHTARSTGPHPSGRSLRNLGKPNFTPKSHVEGKSVKA